jgi:hypothetical protein
MAIFYELWDIYGGSRMGEFRTLPSALEEVRAGIREDGPEPWREVGLLQRTYGGGETRKLAEGEALIAMAQATGQPSTTRQQAPSEIEKSSLSQRGYVPPSGAHVRRASESAAFKGAKRDSAVGRIMGHSEKSVAASKLGGHKRPNPKPPKGGK